MFSHEPIKVILASKSKIKIDALMKVLDKPKFIVIPIHVESDVNQQPLNDETMRGAINRVENAIKANNNGDIYISVENGVYEHDDGCILDKAVIWMKCRKPDDSFTDSTEITESIEFPKDCFLKAKETGFDKTVVAQVMVDQKLVTSRDDPHKDLVKKISRVDLIADGLRRMKIEEKYQKAQKVKPRNLVCK